VSEGFYEKPFSFPGTSHGEIRTGKWKRVKKNSPVDCF